MYKAKIAIGGYKVGDEVPADKAKLWNEMYTDSPVEEVGGSPSADSSEEKKGQNAPVDSDAMYDDYLNRNTDVVLKALKTDKLKGKVLGSLLNIESKNKNRKPVIDAIKFKLRNL